MLTIYGIVSQFRKNLKHIIGGMQTVTETADPCPCMGEAKEPSAHDQLRAKAVLIERQVQSFLDQIAQHEEGEKARNKLFHMFDEKGEKTHG